MKGDEALRKVLKDLTIALSEDNEFRDIRFRNDEELGAINEDGIITINPDHKGILDENDKLSEEQEFALIVNTESHELEHGSVTIVEDMRNFAEEYEGKRPRLAGFVWNIVEDAYIDKRRTDRDRGLRPVQALFSDLLHENQKPITEFEPPQKHANAVLQISKAGGTPVGFEDVDDEEFRDYCAEVRALIDEARNTPIQDERTEIAHNIMDLIADHAGELDTPDIEMPDFMVVPEEMMDDDGDPLPEPSESDEGDEQEQDGGGQGMTIMTEPQSGECGESGGGGNQEQTCPSCGSTNINEVDKNVDGMTAAKCNAPFSTSENWVGNAEFVAHNNQNGVCGFRVTVSGEVPESRMNNMGFKVVDIGGSKVEVLEPKENYDDTETITEFECEDCGHEWLPTL